MNDTYTIGSVAGLLKAYRWMRTNPTGRIATGEWPNEWLSCVEWHDWFIGCLNTKINREDVRHDWRKMQYEYQQNMRRDCRIVRDYQRRIVRSGRNVLNTREMQVKYPHINNREQ